MHRAGTSLALAFASFDAGAHGGPGESWWSFDPWTWGGFALLVLLRPRRAAPFVVAAAALFLALLWPFDALAHESFAAHMVQHMLLIAVAAPLLVLSRPSLPWLKGFAAAGSCIRFLSMTTIPLVAFGLHAAAIWLGHAPRLIEAALASRATHIAMHAVLLGTACLLWWSLRSRARAGEAALWTLGTMIHTSLLGALLTFAPRLLYSGASLADQQAAGLVMWVPGGLLYLAAGLAFASAWLGARERPA